MSPIANKVEHYLILVDGLFGLRALDRLSDNTEAEIAGTHDLLWETMAEKEQDEVERGIEALKKKWKKMPTLPPLNKRLPGSVV
jgi:hypothetical protein